MSRPRVVLVTLENFSEMTGQSVRLGYLLPWLARWFDVTLVGRPQQLPPAVSDAVGGFIELPLPGEPRPLACFFHPFGLLRLMRLRAALGRLPARDAILYTDSILLGDMCRASGARRRVVELNGIISEEFRGKGLRASGWLYNVLRRWERAAVGRADRLIVVSRSIARFVAESFGLGDQVSAGDRVTILGNGVDPDLFHPQVDGTAIRRARDWGSGPVGVFVGTFRPYHGVENLIAMLPLVLERRPEFRLVLVGEGPRRLACEDLVRRLDLGRSVEFAGPVAHEETPRWIAAADLALYYPDYHAGSGGFLGDPIKYYEYMAVGKPVVTIREPNLAQAVSETAILTAAGHQAYAQAVLELLDNPRRMADAGRTGAEYVLRNHTWESVAREIARICGVEPD